MIFKQYESILARILQTRPLLKVPTFHIRVLEALHTVQPLVNLPGKKMDDGPRMWAIVTARGIPDGLPTSWFRVNYSHCCGLMGVNHCVDDHCLLPFSPAVCSFLSKEYTNKKYSKNYLREKSDISRHNIHQPRET